MLNMRSSNEGTSAILPTYHYITSMMSHKILELSYFRLEKRIDEEIYYTQKT